MCRLSSGGSLPNEEWRTPSLDKNDRRGRADKKMMLLYVAKKRKTYPKFLIRFLFRIRIKLQ